MKPGWDNGKVRMCVCDPGYAGVDCARRTCPACVVLNLCTGLPRLDAAAVTRIVREARTSETIRAVASSTRGATRIVREAWTRPSTP